MGKTILLRI